MATSLVPSPSAARAGSLLAQGGMCVWGEWQRRQRGLGCSRALRFPKHKTKQVSRIFISKLALALKRHLTVKNKMCITCICWGHRGVFLSTCPEAISGLATQINPSVKDRKNYTPQYYLISVLFAVHSPRLFLLPCLCPKHCLKLVLIRSFFVYASVYIPVKCSSHFEYNVHK